MISQRLRRTKSRAARQVTRLCLSKPSTAGRGSSSAPFSSAGLVSCCAGIDHVDEIKVSLPCESNIHWSQLKMEAALRTLIDRPKIVFNGEHRTLIIHFCTLFTILRGLAHQRLWHSAGVRSSCASEKRCAAFTWRIRHEGWLDPRLRRKSLARPEGPIGQADRPAARPGDSSRSSVPPTAFGCPPQSRHRKSAAGQ